jgi:hypothetical protein
MNLLAAEQRGIDLKTAFGGLIEITEVNKLWQ